MPFRLTSPAFGSGQPILRECARNGGNHSPQLDWIEPPEGTQSFVLILEDADAPLPAFRHWTVYDIRSSRGGAAARVQRFRRSRLRRPAAAVRRSTPHLPLPPGRPRSVEARGGRPTARGQVLDAARNHILPEAELVGTFAAGA